MKSNYFNSTSDWEAIKKSRFEGFVERVEYYLYLLVDFPKHKLTPVQTADLTEARDALYFFGEDGTNWAGLANEILTNH